MSGPLSGVRVLDLSRLLSGPFCTMLLSDLGAEVVKVERPGQGDPARNLGPRVGDDAAYFISVNRGKKSITLDLFSEEGKRVFLSLVPHFDVLVENFVPGQMARSGLEYAGVRQVNPGLIYTSISGFGQDGPEARRPALDIVVQAMGGLLSVTGEPDGPLVRPGASLADSIAGVFGALAIVSALYRRRETGQGQHIDMSMLDCQVTMMENAFSRYFATGQVPGPLGSRHPAAAPFQAFQASDGPFVVAVLTDDPQTWQRFCEAIDSPELGNDARFRDNPGRVEHYDGLIPRLENIFKARSAAHWLDVLSQAGFACGPVNDIAAVARDRQVAHRGMIATIDHKTEGTWRVANTPFNFSGDDTGPAGPSPGLGEHTQEVLEDLLKVSSEELGRLRSAGAI